MAAQVQAQTAPGGKSLGLRVSGDLSAHDLILKGFPFAVYGRFLKLTGLPPTAVGEVLHLPPRTLARRKIEGRLHWDESERLFRLAKLFDLATELFNGDGGHAAKWLGTPLPVLRGETPLAMARTGPGATQVEDLIGRLEHGVFT